MYWIIVVKVRIASYGTATNIKLFIRNTQQEDNAVVSGVDESIRFEVDGCIRRNASSNTEQEWKTSHLKGFSQLEETSL